MKALLVAVVLLLLPFSAAHASCPEGSFPLFGCDAAHSKKFIELCAPSPLEAGSGYLVYLFGALNEDGEDKPAELEYPHERAGSLQRFFAATYTHKGIYTQSVRFVSGGFTYRIFTHSRGTETVDAGVEVRDRKTGKTTTVACSERPRFYIFELKGFVPCDPDTPVGKACIE